MGRRGKRIRLAEGVFADHGGIAARVRVGSGTAQRTKEKRYPIGTDLRIIQQWQLRARADLLSTQPAKAARGSLAAAVPRFLATLTGRRKKDMAALLHHWTASPLGNQARDAISRPQITTQLATWETAGVAASTLNHRLLALRALYRELDAGDEHAYNPTVGIKKRPEPEPTPKAVSYDLIEAIIAFMPDRGRQLKVGEKRPTVSQTKARARVLAWTGLPPAQVMKIQPSDVDWEHCTLRVTPRRKGKGTRARVVPLLPQAVNALRWFFAAGATGPYSTSAFYKTWLTAQRRLVRALKALAKAHGADPDAIVLPRISPYSLRHSFGTEAVKRSKGNLLGVQTLMLHARVSTTERYLKSALEHSAQSVINAWADESGASRQG